MILGSAYRPPRNASRLAQTADLTPARRSWETSPSRNLTHLLGQRYGWCNDHIGPDDVGVEFAAGIGAAKDFLRCASLLLTDVDGGDWLDRTGIDATDSPFADDSFDFVLISNALHHLAHPIRFFDEAHRILRPGGVALVCDVKCSLVQRVAARLTRVEGYDFDVDPFDRVTPTCDPDDPWASNNATPDLLFDDVDEFERRVPQFDVAHHEYSEFLGFLNSGGVTHKTPYVPLPRPALRAVDALDGFLTRRWPSTFALQRRIVLRAR